MRDLPREPGRPFAIADVLGHRTMGLVKRYSYLAQGHKTIVVEKMARERGL
jgi:hypothetical protein